jgi:(p)ppGpp synthase/HD superfamily hydrolase
MTNIHDFTAFCEKAHGDQKRWDGSSYFKSHCLQVAASCLSFRSYCSPEYWSYLQSNLDDLYCVGVGHDVLEDTEATYEDVKALSNEMVADAIKKLTKEKDNPYITYAGYLKNLCSNFDNTSILAMIVKQADIENNLSTLSGEKHNQRRDKYELALIYIQERIASR